MTTLDSTIPVDEETYKTWRWQERADQWLGFPLGRFLDYGCGSCGLLEKVSPRCVECHGVDVDSVVIDEAKKNFPEYTLHVIGLDGKTPYPDAYFDTIAIVEVVEHVPHERTALAEIARILKPGGKLLLTTPHKGLLTFLDIGNFKFAFPKLHRWIHLRILRNHAYYERRFARAAEKGLIGDISVSPDRKPWHRHYKPIEIVNACSSSLIPERRGVYFPGMRAFMLLRTVVKVCTRGKGQWLFRPLWALERRLSRVESRMGDQLVMLFTKRG